MRGKKLSKIVITLLAVAMLSSLLAACSRGDGGSSTDSRVLRIGVMYGGQDQEPWFRQQYTDSYELLNQNVEIEIVPVINYDSMNYYYGQPGEEREKQPDPYEELQKLLTGDNPVDVMVVEYNMLRRMVQDNLLKELDPLIQQDNFDISDYVPTVIEGIKSAGDNKLYALTSTFTSSAMFYNKKIFQDAGVEPPTDGMSWDDVINLARRVTSGEGEDRKYGFMMNRWGGDGFYDVQTYSASQQLRMFDEQADTMLVNTPNWEKAWTTVSDLYKDKIMPTNQDVYGMHRSEGPMNPFQHDLFLSGRTAMMIGDYYYLNDLRRAEASKDNYEDFQMVDWDVVTVPDHPEAPGIGGNIYLNQLMGINAKAQNPDDAWNFVKFLNSKEWARLKSRSTNEIVARKEFIAPMAGLDYNVSAFYSMKPVPPTSSTMDDIYRKYPYIYEAVNYPGQMLFQEVMEEKKTVKEALAEWETKGNANLKQMKENPDQPLQIYEPMPGIEGGVIDMVY